jgi:hypothetical protein
VPRKIFGSNRDEIIGGWRQLHNEECHNLYFLTNMARMIKSRRLKWAEHVSMHGREVHIKFWWETMQERDH